MAGSGNGGHPFPSSGPITPALCALRFAQGLGPHQKKLETIPFTRVKIPFGTSWAKEAAMDSEERVPLDVEILSLRSYSSHQH